MRSPDDIEIHIAELVLHGVDPSDRRAVGEAVERELGRLLGESGWPGDAARPASIGRVDGGEFTVAPGAGAAAIGAGVAAAVHRGLPRAPAPPAKETR